MGEDCILMINPGQWRLGTSCLFLLIHGLSFPLRESSGITSELPIESMLTLAEVWEPLALFYLDVMIGILYLDSITMKLSGSIWLNGFVLCISKWKKNPTKKQSWAPLKPSQDFKMNVIVYYVHFLPLPSVVHWLIGQFSIESIS